jgi:hypothetical protein
LTCKNNKDFDIIKISKVLKEAMLIPSYWTLSVLKSHLLWVRSDEKKFIIDGVEYSESTLRSLIKKATE